MKCKCFIDFLRPTGAKIFEQPVKIARFPRETASPANSITEPLHRGHGAPEPAIIGNFSSRKKFFLSYRIF